MTPYSKHSNKLYRQLSLVEWYFFEALSMKHKLPAKALFRFHTWFDPNWLAVTVIGQANHDCLGVGNRGGTDVIPISALDCKECFSIYIAFEVPFTVMHPQDAGWFMANELIRGLNERGIT